MKYSQFLIEIHETYIQRVSGNVTDSSFLNEISKTVKEVENLSTTEAVKKLQPLFDVAYCAQSTLFSSGQHQTINVYQRSMSDSVIYLPEVSHSPRSRSQVWQKPHKLMMQISSALTWSGRNGLNVTDLIDQIEHMNKDHGIMRHKIREAIGNLLSQGAIVKNEDKYQLKFQPTYRI